MFYLALGFQTYSNDQSQEVKISILFAFSEFKCVKTWSVF